MGGTQGLIYAGTSRIPNLSEMLAVAGNFFLNAGRERVKRVCKCDIKFQ